MHHIVENVIPRFNSVDIVLGNIRGIERDKSLFLAVVAVETKAGNGSKLVVRGDSGKVVVRTEGVKRFDPVDESVCWAVVSCE